MANYDWVNQDIVASALIEPSDADPFFNPAALSHNGYDRNGDWYTDGAVNPAVPKASWWQEFSALPGPFRGSAAAFPQYGLVLLSPAAASYNAYDNFEQRGEHFATLVGARRHSRPAGDGPKY